MTQETHDGILHSCNRIMEIVESIDNVIDPDKKEDLHFFVSYIENLVYLNKLKNTLAESN